MRIKSIVFLSFLVCVSCSDKKSGEVFTKLSSKQTGISFANTLKETNDLNILDYLYFYNGGGIAIGDINNDGLPDIYLSANQMENKLYLNRGGMRFEDITEKAGVAGKSSWNTGSVMGDVNGDGLLDIYVCAVVGINGFNGHNELFINQGDGTFKEESSAYGLDFESYSSNAAFLDYDLDGDLDIYLLNHAVHTQNSFGKVTLRFERNYETGDKLLRNDNGIFVDVSEEAGIYGGINGYGLGIAISDFNLDGFPDIFVGNDFHEDDYYYVNNGDGTFTESLRNYFGHTSRFSMGSDVADINHDGRPDLISLDMLPEDERVLKSSEGDDNFQVQKLRIKDFGYHYQFSRNMLYLNQPDGRFLETALASGVAATDWSWSALFGDYNHDGEQDLFISNGIPKRPNDLDYINYLSNENVEKKINNTNLIDKKALGLMPSGAIGNKIFQGSQGPLFVDQSKHWIGQDTLVSTASAYGDLDNDGDLDLITNNLNHQISFYENTINNNAEASYLKLKFHYQKGNPFGVGTKVTSYSKGKIQFRELYTVKGFQASSEPIVHFGFKNLTKIDSLKIEWPDNTFQIIKDIATNQTLEISPTNTLPQKKPVRSSSIKMFNTVEDNLGLDFIHKEDSYSDFNRQKLIPYQKSDRGPAVSIGDLNGDGKEDVFFGGSKYIPSSIYIQKDSTFKRFKYSQIYNDSINEDISSLIGDFNSDGKNDLILGTGGADFYGEMKPLRDAYFLYKDSTYIKTDFPEFFENASKLLQLDYDHDNDMDVIVANQSISADYGKKPNSYLLENINGKFEAATENPFNDLGLITDAIVTDFNNDGWEDLLFVGEWMSPRFFENRKGSFIEITPLDDANLNGLWQAVESFDIDGDGDLDYLLGNWGTNTKFKASQKHPLKMYYGDFDKNGTTETIVCIYNKDNYYPIDGLNELSGQLSYLRKKFTTYSSFAGTPIEDIFDTETLAEAETLNVEFLTSGYLKNENGTFTFMPFPFEMQLAPIMDFLRFDFDGDNKEEVLAGGNYFGVKPYHGRFDSFPGALIKSEENIISGNRLGLNFMFKSLRHLGIIKVSGQPYLLATFNNEKVQVYSIIQ